MVIHSKSGARVTIATRRSIAHRAIVHGPCHVGADVFIGFNSVLFNCAVVCAEGEIACASDTGPTREAGDTRRQRRHLPRPPGRTHPEDRPRAMTWTQRLKRVFGIDIATCLRCGGAVRILASVEEPDAIEKILAHFDRQGALPQAYYQPATRRPPAAAA